MYALMGWVRGPTPSARPLSELESRSASKLAGFEALLHIHEGSEKRLRRQPSGDRRTATGRPIGADRDDVCAVDTLHHDGTLDVVPTPPDRGLRHVQDGRVEGTRGTSVRDSREGRNQTAIWDRSWSRACARRSRGRPLRTRDVFSPAFLMTGTSETTRRVNNGITSKCVTSLVVDGRVDLQVVGRNSKCLHKEGRKVSFVPAARRVLQGRRGAATW